MLYESDLLIEDYSIVKGRRNAFEYMTSVKPAFARRNFLLEKAEIQWDIFENFADEGQDYQKLRDLYQELVYMHNLQDQNLASHGKGFMHWVKRYCQIVTDVEGVFWLIWSFLLFWPIIFYIWNRLERYLYDTIEYKNMVKDFRKLLVVLKAKESQCKDPKQRKKLQESIKQAEEMLRRTEGGYYNF